MVGELITLPLRLSMRAADTMLRAGIVVSGRTLNLAGEVLKTFTSNDTDGAEARDDAPQRERHDEQRVRREQPEAEVQPPTPPTSQSAPQPKSAPPQAEREQPPIPQEPPHVSEEPVLVEEFAEPGAEDGAGPTVEIDKPWEDYDQMTAKNIVARLRDCSTAQLAMVELYESTNRNRETVLAAVRRELETADGDGRTT